MLKSISEDEICLYFDLVDEVVKKYLDYGLEYLDLFQEGCIGLVNATKTFNPLLGKFIPYAKTCINSSIVNALKKRDLIGISFKDRCKITNIKSIQENYYKKNGENISLQDLSTLLGLSPKRVDELLLAMEMESSIENNISDLPLNNCDIEKSIMDSDEENNFRSLISYLMSCNPRAAIMCLMHYGFIGFPTMTLEKISNVFGISRQAVSSRELSILKKAKKFLESETWSRKYFDLKEFSLDDINNLKSKIGELFSVCPNAAIVHLLESGYYGNAKTPEEISKIISIPENFKNYDKLVYVRYLEGFIEGIYPNIQNNLSNNRGATFECIISDRGSNPSINNNNYGAETHGDIPIIDSFVYHRNNSSDRSVSLFEGLCLSESKICRRVKIGLLVLIKLNNQNSLVYLVDGSNPDNTLIDVNMPFDDSITTVSSNSPLGGSILHGMVDDNVIYDSPDGKQVVQILGIYNNSYDAIKDFKGLKPLKR